MSFEDGNLDEFDRLKEVLASHPEVAPDVQLLIEPNLNREKFFELIDKINDRDMPEREGMYSAISFLPRPKREVCVKYFENGRLTVSGSDLEGVES